MGHIILCLGSGVPSRSVVRVEKSKNIDEFSLDKSKDEESKAKGKFLMIILDSLYLY